MDKPPKPPITQIPPPERVSGGNGWDEILEVLDSHKGAISDEAIRKLEAYADAREQELDMFEKKIISDPTYDSSEKEAFRKDKREVLKKISSLRKLGMGQISMSANTARFVREIVGAEQKLARHTAVPQRTDEAVLSPRPVQEESRPPKDESNVPERAQPEAAPREPEVPAAQEANEVRESQEEAPVQEAPLPEAALAPAADTVAETRKEKLEALKKAAYSASELAEKVGVAYERKDMRAKEDAYLTAYKRLERRRTVWNRLTNRDALKEESMKVDALKKAYDAARVSYAGALARAAETSTRSLTNEKKIQDRFYKLEAAGKLPPGKDGQPMDFIEYMQWRNERLAGYVTWREAIRPQAEKKLQARAEALDSRGKNALQKGLGWLNVQNQKLEQRLGSKKAAIAVRALVSAVGVTGLLAAAGSFGTVGVLSAAGLYGSQRFVRGLMGAVAGRAAAAGAGMAYEKFSREGQEKAREEIKTAGRAGTLTPEELAAIDVLRDKLAEKADERTFQKRKRLYQALAAIAVGGATAGLLANSEVVERAADAMPDADTDATGTSQEGKAQSSAPAAKEVASGGAPAEAVASPAQEAAAPQESAAKAEAPAAKEASPAVAAPAEAPSAPAAEAWSATIDRPGEGASQLLVDLREHYGKLYPDAADAPPAIRHILEAESADALSREYGFIDAANKSIVVHEGATLGIDAKGSLVFTPGQGADAHVLAAVNADGTLAPADPLSAEDGTYRSPVVQEAPAAEAEAPAADTPVPEADPSDALNRVQAELGREWNEAAEARKEAHAPAAEAPAPPAAPEVPPSAPDPSESSMPQAPEAPVGGPASMEPFTNHNGVEINPAQPQAYAYPAENGEPVYQMYGGRGEEPFLAAQQFASQSPAGTEVRFGYWQTDSATGERTFLTGGFVSNGDGFISPVLDDFPAPDPERFTERLPFAYKPK